VDEDFLNTYNIRLIAGKNFSGKLSSIQSVIINEAALQTLKFGSPQEALNHRIHWQRKEFEVIGVFANYNHLFLKQAFEPIMLSFHPAASGFITMNVEHERQTEALRAARREFKALFPDTPFEYNFLESSYDRQYRSIQQFELAATFFAVLAIVIACLGLFCLSYYAVQRRIREVAVRRIFGAGVLDVLLLLAKRYVMITFLSCLIGAAVTFYIMQDWLQNFAFAIRLSPIDFLIPLVMIYILVIVTVFFNSVKTAVANPTHSLKQN
jgi:putative ABC transport system permease protein